MVKVTLKNVNLAFPMLGGGNSRKLSHHTVSGAGAIVKDNAGRGKSIMALANISFDLHKGDRIGLIGCNGSGKSTLLKVIAGIYEPISGRVKVEGMIASLLNVGLGIRNEATGYRNIELSCLIMGLPASEIAKKIDEIADFSELGQYLDMPVRTYSNGMAMRLKFACATSFSPEILLMDEWLGAGDPQFQAKARARMKELVERTGILVLASHNHSQLREQCEHAIWLHKGEMRAFGPIDEVIYLYKKHESGSDDVNRPGFAGGS